MQCENVGIDEPTGEQLRGEIGPLINHIRFPLISPTDFIKEIGNCYFYKKFLIKMVKKLGSGSHFRRWARAQKRVTKPVWSNVEKWSRWAKMVFDGKDLEFELYFTI